MKRYLLVNGWSDDNKGDAAIVAGLIHLLRQALKASDSSEIKTSILSNLPADDPRFQYHYRHTAAKGTFVAVFGSLLPAIVFATTRPGRWAKRLWNLLLSLLMLAFGATRWCSSFIRLTNPDRYESFKALTEADVVISKGGHIFSSTGSLLSLVGLYTNAFPLLLAQRLGKNTYIYGQSIGPIHGALHRRVIAGLLSRCTGVYAREELSRDYVSQLCKDIDCQLVWDTAFVVPGEPLPLEVEQQLPKNFVALTLRQWEFPYSGGKGKKKYLEYLTALAETITFVNQEYGMGVVLVPQVIGPTPLENDLTAWDDLRSVLDVSTVYDVRHDLTPGQLRTLYSKADLLVGTRFHSVILALSAGVPAVAISYHGYKTRGIMRMLGLEEYVLEIDDLTGAALTATVSRIHDTREDFSRCLREQMVRVHEDSIETVSASLV